MSCRGERERKVHSACGVKWINISSTVRYNGHGSTCQCHIMRFHDKYVARSQPDENLCKHWYKNLSKFKKKKNHTCVDEIMVQNHVKNIIQTQLTLWDILKKEANFKSGNKIGRNFVSFISHKQNWVWVSWCALISHELSLTDAPSITCHQTLLIFKYWSFVLC